MGTRQFRREYHQSCAQPGFRVGKKRCHFWAFAAYFPVFGAKKGRKKTRAQPWYARKSGKSHVLTIILTCHCIKSLWRGVNKNGVSNFLRSIGHFFFCSLKLLGPGDLRKQVCLGPKTLHFAKVWGSKCDKNKCGKHSGKFVKLVFARKLRFVAETSKNSERGLRVGLGDPQQVGENTGAGFVAC